MLELRSAASPGPLVVYALILLAAVVYWPSATALHVIWTDTQSRGYTHGYLIAGLCVWLLIRSAPDIAAQTFKPWIPALIAVPFVSVLWLVSLNAGLREAHLLLYPFLAGLAVLGACGWAVARQIAFPLGFFYFSIPVWGHINWILQTVTTHVTVFLLKIVGVPTQMDGNIIHIPAGSFEVAGGCSGLHYFVVGLAIAALIGELDRESLRRRAYLVALMGFLALVCNWVRVFVIVLAGQLTNMQSYLVRVDHYWFGWGLFGVVMLGFVWYVSRSPVSIRKRDTSTYSAATPSTRTVVIAAALLAVFPLIQRLVHAVPAASAAAASAMPGGRGGWTGPFSPAEGWRPIFHGASSESMAAYRDRDSRAIEVYNVVYLRQRQGAELIGYGNSLLGDAGLEQKDESIVMTSHGPVVETLAVDARGRDSVIWSVYEVGGRTFAKPLEAQLWFGVSALASRPVSSLGAARAVCTPDCGTAREKLGRFFDQMWSQLRGPTPTENKG